MRIKFGVLCRVKILAVIPARYDSTRLPGKPLADILGKPMIQWVYEAVKNCAAIQEVIVATDDNRIVEVVKSFGGKVQLTDKNQPNGTSRCIEVAKNQPDYDFVINVQGDEPLINPKQLEVLLKELTPQTEIASAYRVLNNATEIADPSVVKVVTDTNNKALYFSRSVVPYNRDGAKVIYKGHVGLYIFKRAVLIDLEQLKPGVLERVESLEQLRWLENGFSIQMIETDEPSPAVDTPEGLDKVRELMKIKLNS